MKLTVGEIAAIKEGRPQRSYGEWVPMLCDLAIEAVTAREAQHRLSQDDEELVKRLTRGPKGSKPQVMYDAAARIQSLSAEKDAALDRMAIDRDLEVNQLKATLCTARDQVVAFMIEGNYSPEQAVSNVSYIDAILSPRRQSEEGK